MKTLKKMKIFDIFLFFTILHFVLSEILMIPRVIKEYFGWYQYNHINFSLFFLCCIWFFYINKKINLPKGSFFLGAVFLFLVYFMDNISSVCAGNEFFLKNNILATINFISIFFLTLFLLSRPREILNSFLRAYIYISMFFSLCSVITFFILLYDPTIANDHVMTLLESEKHVFSWPLGLSFVNIANTETRYMLGMEFYMYYSWFLEPQFFAFFVFPSLFFIDRVRVKHKKTFCFLLVFSLFLTISLTIFMVLFLCLGYLFIKRVKSIYLIISGFIVVFLILSGGLGIKIDDRSLFNKISGSSANTTYSFLKTVLYSENVIGKPLKQNRHESARTFSVIKDGSFITSFIFILFYLFNGYLLFKGLVFNKSDFSLIHLGILLFMTKDIVMYVSMPIFLFLYFLYLYLFIQNEDSVFKLN